MTTTTPRVWIACLAAYSAGRLHGEWVDATDETELEEARDRILASSPVPGAEEWAIHDYEGFGGLSSELGEYPDLADVAKIGALIEEHGEAVALAIDALEPDLDDVDEDWFFAHYRGVHSDEGEFAYENVKEIGWSNVPGRVWPSPYASPEQGLDIFEELSSYIDWESIARELFQHGNYESRRASEGGIHVFEQEV